MVELSGANVMIDDGWAGHVDTPSGGDGVRSEILVAGGPGRGRFPPRSPQPVVWAGSPRGVGRAGRRVVREGSQPVVWSLRIIRALRRPVMSRTRSRKSPTLVRINRLCAWLALRLSTTRVPRPWESQKVTPPR